MNDLRWKTGRQAASLFRYIVFWKLIHFSAAFVICVLQGSVANNRCDVKATD